MERQPHSHERLATAFQDLRERVESEEIVGSNGVYTVDQLNDAIGAAYASRFNMMNGFTSSGNVRSEAACLFISEAESFDELSRLLKCVKEIEGTDGTVYSGEQLANEVANVASVEAADEETWENFYNRITRQHGLRDAVKRCVKNRDAHVERMGQRAMGEPEFELDKAA